MSNVIVQSMLLIFIRVLSFLALAPFFSQKGFPMMARIIVAAGITVGIYPFVSPISSAVSLFILGLLALKETLLGLALGYLCQLVFYGIEIAGHIIDFQIGFSMAQAYDPEFQLLTSPFGRMYYWMATALMFVTNLHLVMIKGFIHSFSLVGLASGNMGGASVDGVVHLVSLTIAMGFNLAMPLLLSALLIDIVTGVISRVIPQINVLILGLSIKSFVAFILMIYLIPNIASFLMKELPNIVNYMEPFLKSLN